MLSAHSTSPTSSRARTLCALLRLTACSSSLVLGLLSTPAPSHAAQQWRPATKTESTTKQDTRTAALTDTASKPAGAITKPDTWGAVQLVLYKSKRTLLLYRYGEFVKQYPVLLGFKPEGRKRHQYDAKTPEGYYHIIHKRPHERWGYFLSINYPNRRDQIIYAAERESGLIPKDRGKTLPIGFGLGIHGNDKPEKQSRGVDWTKGCIAMENTDIDEIYAIVEVGTPIWLLE
jgi:murein L,D-transpeptidase YafK